MNVIEIILSAGIVITAIFFIVTILLQPGKNSGVAGALSGGADTFLSRNKGKTKEAKLAMLTRIFAGLFIICILALNLV